MKVKDIYYSDAVSVGDDFLAHHGIKGQRWGVRRYQNEDGTYTSAGKKRRTLKQIQHDNREKAISKIMAKKHVDRKTAEKIHKRNRAITAAQILASTMLTGWAIGSTAKEHREAKNIREANRAINKLRMEDLKREADRVANSLRHSDLYYGGHFLAHHGIKGQRWGVRRYQNEDGTYTSAGKKRYALSDAMNRKLMAYDTKQNINRISKSAERKAESLIKDKKINSKNPIEDANKIATEWNKFDSEIEKRRQNGKINKQKYEELKMLGKSQKLNQISRYDNDKQVQKLVSNLIKEYSKDYDVIYDAEFENYGLRKKT